MRRSRRWPASLKIGVGGHAQCLRMSRSGRARTRTRMTRPEPVLIIECSVVVGSFCPVPLRAFESAAHDTVSHLAGRDYASDMVVLDQVAHRLEKAAPPGASFAWDLDGNPPSVLITDPSGARVRIEEMSSEMLVSVDSCAVTGALRPDVELLLRVFSACGRMRICVVRSCLLGIPLRSWIEIGGIPISYDAEADRLDRVLSRIPGYRERRTVPGA